MFTLRQLSEGHVNQSIDTMWDTDNPYRMIYTMYSEDTINRPYAFMRYHRLVQYRPVNYASVRDIYDHVRESINLGSYPFNAMVKDFRIVRLSEGMWESVEVLEYTDRPNQLAPGTGYMVKSSDIVWLIYDRHTKTKDMIYTYHRNLAYVIASNRYQKNSYNFTRVRPMSRDLAEDILEGRINVGWESDKLYHG